MLPLQNFIMEYIFIELIHDPFRFFQLHFLELSAYRTHLTKTHFHERSINGFDKLMSEKGKTSYLSYFISQVPINAFDFKHT